MNVPNSNLPQENIKIILKNDDAYLKRQKVKKRDKKSRKEKSTKAFKEQAPPPQKKEVFASGDNILISVCFNKNNNNVNNSGNNGTSNNNSTNSNKNNNSNSNTNGNHEENEKSKADVATLSEEKLTAKSKTKKRLSSPASILTSSSESYEKKMERRSRKHKRKKMKIDRRDRIASKSPKTPPMNPPPSSIHNVITKRKVDAKPIAIIDLDKSPGKEITQSPKEVIILTDSDGDNKKRDKGSNEIVIIDDTVLEKGIHLSPSNATPESPPPTALSQPVLKFALKSKSNILPFNLLHDQAEEIEEPTTVTNSSTIIDHTVSSNKNNTSGGIQKEQDNVPSSNSGSSTNIITNNSSSNSNNNNNNNNNNNGMILIDEKKSNQNDAYDPFEPTKSRSASPVTPAEESDTMETNIKSSGKNESLIDRVQMMSNKDSNQIPGLGNEEHQSSTLIWNRKEKSSQPMPPSFSFSSTSIPQSKPHVSLYDGIYGSDLKTPAVLPSPKKISSFNDKNKSHTNDEDDDDYSPSSDGFDYEPVPSSTHHHHHHHHHSHHPGKSSNNNKNSYDSMKHSDIDTQSSGEPSSFSFGNDDVSTSKSTPLKLTASTLKTFNSTMRSSASTGLQFVNKAELSIFENYLPPSQQKSPLTKRPSNSSFIRSKMSRFTSSMNENSSPHRNISYTDTLKPPVIGMKLIF
jgi:hypothetical protein